MNRTYNSRWLVTNIPYLPLHPAHGTEKLLVKDIMTRKAITLPPLVKVADALKLLRATRHNGFPVVMEIPSDKAPHTEVDMSEFNPRSPTIQRSQSYSKKADKKYVGM